jgi:hypothetical protein
VRAVNSGNVHETLDPVLGHVGAQTVRFEPTILLRGASRTLRGAWSVPLLCWCQVQVHGLASTALVFPFKGAGLLVALLLLGLLVGRRLRRMQP